MSMQAPPTKEQSKDIDFLLTAGEMFTLVVYGQLILENAKIYSLEAELLDQIFDFMVRDFSKYALQLYSKPSSTAGQMELCQRMIMKPPVDAARFGRIWDEVHALRDAYEMSPLAPICPATSQR
jgi:acyl-CoA dehydrogenase